MLHNRIVELDAASSMQKTNMDLNSVLNQNFGLKPFHEIEIALCIFDTALYVRANAQTMQNEQVLWQIASCQRALKSLRTHLPNGNDISQTFSIILSIVIHPFVILSK